MLKSEEIERKAMQWVAVFPGESFSLEEIGEELNVPEWQDPEEREHFLTRLGNVLDTFDTLLRTRGSDTFYAAERFFHGQVFYCCPRKMEIEKGILIPGARFEAFHPEELYVTELEIHTKAGTLPLTDLKCPYGDVSDLFFLLGPAGTFDMLTAESLENYDAMREAGGLRDSLPVEMEVFDCREFYRETDFQSGDYIRFEIDSYLNGSLRAERVPHCDIPSGAEVSDWITRFEKALTHVCTDFRDSLEIPRQIQMAYLYAADLSSDLRTLPAPPIDRYHTMMRSISFRRNGMEWTLSAEDELAEEEVCTHEHHEPGKEECCSCGHDHHDHGKKEPEMIDGGLTPEDLAVSAGTVESPDAILEELESPVGMVEIRSLMLSVLAGGTDSFEEFERICGEYLELSFRDEGQEAVFRNALEELWELLCERYSSHLDERKAPLRERLLDLTRTRIALSRRLLEGKDEKRTDRFREEIRELHRNIIDTLAVLDRDAVLEEGHEYEDMDLRIGDLEDACEILQEKIAPDGL